MVLLRRAAGALVVAVLAAGCATPPAAPELKPDTQNAAPKEIPLPAKEPAAAKPAPRVPSPPTELTSPAREPAVEQISERPDLLLNLGEIYGYSIAEDRLIPLSASGGASARHLTVSPDGQWFAYLRDGGKYSPDLTICLRPVMGGAAHCVTGEMDKTNAKLSWAPGTGRLVLSNGAGIHTYAVQGDNLQVVHRLTNPAVWSPDGAWYVEDTAKERWLVNSKAPSLRTPLPAGAGLVRWIGSSLLAIVVEEPKGTGIHDRRNRLVLMDLAGKVTDVPKLEDGELITSLLPDPQGRFLVVETSVQMSVLKHWADRVYDINGGKWLSLPAEVSGLIDWGGNGRFLLGSGSGGSKLLVEPGTNRVTPLKTGLDGRFLGFSANGEWLAYLKTEPNSNSGRSLTFYHLPTNTTKVLTPPDKWVEEAVWVPRP